MDDKKLKKISKKELLEILLSQANRIEELEKELELVKEELTSKRIIIKNSGSIAEAALKLNGIFEQAQKAADDYLENIKESCKQKVTTKKNKPIAQKEKNKDIEEVTVDKIVINKKGKIIKSSVVKRVMKNEKNKK